ncbi:MAG: hypothetical protein CME06_01940 [Gemmatimonadetes bacterium]|nr:hypothetical protein [Gemmatimonadota bacterium]
MRIYFLAHRIPHPPDKGEKIRAYHQLRHLARSHEVTLATHVESKDDLAGITALERWCERIDWAPRPTGPRMKIRLGTALLRGEALSFAAFRTGALERKVRAGLRRDNPDVVFCYGAAMAPYVMHHTSARRVIDFVDADSAKWSALATRGPLHLKKLYAQEARRVVRAEARILSELDQAIVACEGERNDLGGGPEARAHSSAAIAVIGNGVDLDYFHPDRQGAVPIAEREPMLVFTGVMDYPPNVDGMVRFVREVWPRVQADLPPARLVIVGRHPTRNVRRLAAAPGVSVTGGVPDVRPYLSRATAAVVPLHLSRGVQNKLLEAAAMGLPAVVSSRVAGGTNLEPGRDLIVADDPGRCAKSVLRLLNDRSFAAELGARARRAVEEHHRWDPILERFERLLLGGGEVDA